MSDLFISYSRNDSDFVRKLYAAVESSGREAWLDCFDIPKGERFWEEIKQGIDAADSFVFVLSYSSAEKASRLGNEAYCRREIEHAHLRKKRIIPVVIQTGFHLNREIASHKILGERNWILFDESVDFESSFEALVKTIKTDSSHVKKHTEITVAAERWKQGGGKDKSRLLRGKQLAEAERWLQENQAKASKDDSKNIIPTATSFQVTYIQASRKYARFQRRVALLYLIVPGMLFVPGEYFWREEAVKRDYEQIERLGSVPPGDYAWISYLHQGDQRMREAILNLTSGCQYYNEWERTVGLYFFTSKNQFIRYFKERLRGNCRSLESAKLVNAPLRYADLRGTYFYGADLRGSDLSGADLSDANFEYADLSGATFLSAKLLGANFQDALFIDTSFREIAANLNFADLRAANLRGVDLSGVSLEVVNLSGALLESANLSNSNFIGVDLSRANLESAKLAGVRFECSTVRCSNLSDIKWNEETNWQGVQGWENVENIPSELKQELGLN